MTTFTRDDGRVLPLVEGFRQHVLSCRAPVTPKADWTREQYQVAAARKQARARRLMESFASRFGSLADARLLDVGCGDGSNCLLLARAGVGRMVGIDLQLPLFFPDEKGAQTRRLAAGLLRVPEAGATEDASSRDWPQGVLARALARLPVRFVKMDATRLAFDDAVFDGLISRSAMEHIRPIEQALAEMGRVVRRGGLIYLGIDPFFWLRGCHKRGVVDLPWAHARLTPGEFRRLVAARESEAVATKRCRRLETLNQLTVAQWKALIEAMPCQVLSWMERLSAFGEETLARHPEVLDTLRPGVSKRDLLCERITVWLRKQ
jgi:ubiquinone/menaquinone biosynthesis C-methylase UbiE